MADKTDASTTAGTTPGKEAPWGVVWLAGASTGIGREVALRLAGVGCVIAASARSEDKLKSLKEEAESLPGEIHVYPMDMTVSSQIRTTLNKIRKDLGDIDLALLNAGTNFPVNVLDFRAKQFHDLFDINYFGVVNALEQILPDMIKRQEGHIAVVSSVAGFRGLPTALAYCSSKAALINLCEAMKPELDNNGITLSLVNPGFVKTPLTDKNEFPMPFLMDVEDAAERIVKGLRKRKFEITFPWRFVFWMKLARILPYGVYFWFIKTFVARHAGKKRV